MNYFENGITEGLCKLLSDFEEYELSVIPYGIDPITSRTLVLIPDGEGKSETFVSGIVRRAYRYILRFKHRSTTAADRMRAIGILESVVSHGASKLNAGMIRIVGEGLCGESDGEYAEFSLPIELLVASADKNISSFKKYYVSFDAGFSPVGGGVTRFSEEVTVDTYRRRYIHEDFYRSDILTSSLKYTFEFVVGYESCVLLPLAEGKLQARVIGVLSDGTATLAECAVGNLKITDSVCAGTLVPVGEVSEGTFDEKTGIFRAYVKGQRKESGNGPT